MIGTRLSHYEITGHLGSGGMGDVYQGFDTRLGRDVAIKVLPEPFASDPDRVARFEREARALATLNHPHIAGIYGLEESDGRKFLVMELVDGPTLAQRLERSDDRSPIPLNEALAIAAQVAEALEAAHERGIVHRDLKPANIKIQPNGLVKVLDFGLAKALADGATDGRSNAHLTHSPTLSIAATHAGVILGTAAYMSPEQAKGQTVDRRTDVFSYGCVVYELLTGRPAFPGESVAEILAAVLKADPDWSALPAGTPAAVRRLLRRCLQKDRARRLQSAGDARIEIEDALTEPEPAPAAPPAASVSPRGQWLAWSVAGAFALALAAFVAVFYLRAPVQRPEMRLDIATPATQDPVSLAISPDGRRLVFVASVDGASRLWLRPLDAPVAQPIAGTDGASFPFWSPDGRSIGFFAATKLKRMDIGGVIQTLADAPSARGGTWTRDDAIIFSPASGAGLLRVPASGGPAVAFTKLETPRQNSHRFPQALPDGRHLLYYVQAGGESPDVGGVYLGTIDGSQPKRLTASECAATYSDGWLLYARQGALVARKLDVTSGVMTGDPVTVADPVSVDAQLNIGAFSASATGDIVYRTGGSTRRQLMWFDRSGKPLGALGGAVDDNTLERPDLSPDGRRVVVDRTVQNNVDIWVLDGSRTTRFTFDPATDHWPIWSPDGKWIAFDSTRKGSHDLYLKPANGEADEQLLFDSPEGKGVMDWSRDGRYLLFVSQSLKGTAFDLWTIPLQGDRKPKVFLQTRFDEVMGQFSPDGRWVAYQSNESGQYEIYVRPFPGPGGQWQVSTGGGIAPRWRRDGRELYYIAPDVRLMAAPIVAAGATVEPGTPTMLFRPRIVGGGSNAARPEYAVARDGRFLINVVADETVIAPITLVLNWSAVKK